MEHKIKECIDTLVADHKEISIKAIQAQLDCSSQEIINVLIDMNLNSPANNQSKYSRVTSTHSKHTSFGINEESKRELSEQIMPMEVDATIYKMQKTFSEMAHKLWGNLTETAQNEIELVKQNSANELMKATDQLKELATELRNTRELLHESINRNSEKDREVTEMSSDLVKTKERLISVEIENETSKELIDNLQKNILDQGHTIFSLEQKLSLLNIESTSTLKKALRIEKEKTFLTQEFKNIQKELLHAEGIIKDLYENNTVDSYTLEKAGYKKHNNILNSQSLTNKLFKK